MIGQHYLADIREIAEIWGIPESFSYDQAYLDYEIFVSFLGDNIKSVSFSVSAVFALVLIITGSFSVTILVCLSIILVDVYIYALVHYWGLTFNAITVINIVIAIGLSVDYSAHIAHCYLQTKVPNNAYFRGNKSR